MMLALLSAFAAAACPEPATSAAIELAAEDAESAFQAMDVAAFHEADGRVDSLLGCLHEPLPRPVVARLHRLTGLAAFVDRDLDLAPLAFAAARSVEPEYLLPTSLVPANHPIQALYTAVPLESRVSTTLPAPADGYLLLDGRRGLDRAEGWPVIVQLVDATGQIAWTAALRPGQALPDYVVAPPDAEPRPETDPLASTPPAPTAQRAPNGVAIALIASSGAAAMATGGLYFLSWRAMNSYYATTDYDQLDPLRKRTNTLEYAAWGTGAVALGAGIGAAVTLKW